MVRAEEKTTSQWGVVGPRQACGGGYRMTLWPPAQCLCGVHRCSVCLTISWHSQCHRNMHALPQCPRRPHGTGQLDARLVTCDRTAQHSKQRSAEYDTAQNITKSGRADGTARTEKTSSLQACSRADRNPSMWNGLWG